MNKNLSVLYVEDDLQSREVMRIFIEEVMGLSNITIFENSNDFLQRIGELPQHPDVVLLDIHVPPYNGFTMLNMLRNSPAFADTPIVALTASVMNEEIQKLQEAGFDGIIAKPIDVDTFPVMLNKILAGERVWHVMG